MNSNRKAELQRRLLPGAAPTPPAGLADRIKAEIPKDLGAVPRHRPWPARASGPMRLAASIMVVITSLVVVMYVAAPDGERKIAAPETATRPVIFAPAPRAVSSETTAPATAAIRTEEVGLDMAEAAPPRIPTPIVQSAPLREDSALGTEAALSDERDARAITGSFAEGRVAAVPPPAQIAEAAPDAGMVAPEEPVAAAAAAPAPPAAEREAATMAAAAPVPQSASGRAASSLSLRQQAARAKSEPAADRDLFGITVDPTVFQSIRAMLAAGQKPPASAIDVEAIVNYFTGAPARRPRSGVRLEVEASPAVIEADGDHAVLRFTLDTPAEGTAAIASNARIEIVFNDEVVRSARRIGDGEPLETEATLGPGTSVTGLYALELSPGLRATQTVATVRLHSVRNGTPETVTKTILARDLARSWQNSSRRHRLATLGAMWAETLKGASHDGEIARRARDLATQDPGDVLARELARAASATDAGER